MKALHQLLFLLVFVFKAPKYVVFKLDSVDSLRNCEGEFKFVHEQEWDIKAMKEPVWAQDTEVPNFFERFHKKEFRLGAEAESSLFCYKRFEFALFL
jgi:hypothetical protein